MQHNSHGIDKKFVIKSFTKNELANLYGWSLKTLQRKVRFHKGIWPKGNLLTPKEVRAIIELLGEPHSHFTD